MGNKLRSIYQKMPLFIRTLVVSFFIAVNKIRNFSVKLFRPVKSEVYKPELITVYNKQRQFGPQQKICHAPFTSMFFSVVGKVAPCCATYYKIDADYPQQSLMEIWRGEGYEKIRKQIRQNDLSGICQSCHESFTTKNFGRMLAAKYDNFHFYSEKYPSIMEFELSNSCNMQCIMCNEVLSSGIRSNIEKLPPLELKYDKQFIEQLQEFIPHLKVAEFIGGEPLLIDIYYEIWDLINRMNPECNLFITTNASILNERFLAVMAKNTNLSFNISIDSLKKEVYEAIRIGGNFEKVMKNISVFHDYCRKKKSTLNFMVCPLQKNWNEFPDFVEYCNGMGVCVYFHRVEKPSDLALWSLPHNELLKIHSYLNTFDFPEKELHQKINKNNYTNLVSQIYTWHKQSSERE